MTDNEKAATFIGWKLEEAPWCDDIRECKHAAIDHRCDTHQASYPHRVVPDMTDPRNYMRALKTRFREAVKESNADKYEEIHAALVRILACEDDKAAVEYLADIYDAEHA